MINREMTYEEIQQMVQQLYDRALGLMQFRPEQAFAYVQDETELLQGKDVYTDALLQTAIYKIGGGHGLALSKDSFYAQDMLTMLSEVYDKFSLLEGDDSFNFEANFLADIEAVKDVYLNQ